MRTPAGADLRKLRLALGLSQKHLAPGLGRYVRLLFGQLSKASAVFVKFRERYPKTW